ncbi:XRE family transcriptional regulator [Streptomyces sp. H27-H5]|uniref:XRE family transcriptional regulator n=1 Tax=Streptomyces sp. H27-H5 TaxID=2996460 RepID=UPI0022705C92|nr:XRE family transcriptional regulator [Streptomyces sp. H27-H5]MCY0960805.1 XRE family transcriptional regulator [Streptomyces sp. H27-H5]
MAVMVEQENNAGARTHLSDLVRKRRAELRLSFRQLEERTGLGEDGKPVIRRGTLENLEKVVPRMAWTPRFPELQALADALELPLVQVQDAAGSQFMGIDPVVSEHGRAYVRGADKLTPVQREQIERLIAAFANDGSDATSGTQE